MVAIKSQNQRVLLGFIQKCMFERVEVVRYKSVLYSVAVVIASRLSPPKLTIFLNNAII